MYRNEKNFMLQKATCWRGYQTHTFWCVRKSYNHVINQAVNEEVLVDTWTGVLCGYSVYIAFYSLVILVCARPRSTLFCSHAEDVHVLVISWLGRIRLSHLLMESRVPRYAQCWYLSDRGHSRHLSSQSVWRAHWFTTRTLQGTLRKLAFCKVHIPDASCWNSWILCGRMNS